MAGDGSTGIVILGLTLGIVFFVMLSFIPDDQHPTVMKIVLGIVAVLGLIGIFAS